SLKSNLLSRGAALPINRPKSCSIGEYCASIRPSGAEGECCTRQSAGLCHPLGTLVPFRPGLPEFSPCFPVLVRYSALSLARFSDRRPRTLVRFRSVLCVARRL